MNETTYITDQDIAEQCTNCPNISSKKTRNDKVLSYCKKYEDYCFKTLTLCKVSIFQIKRMKRQVQDNCMNCEFITNLYNVAITKGQFYCLHYFEYAYLVIGQCLKDNKHLKQTTLCENIQKVI